MRYTNAALAAMIALLVTLPVLPLGGDSASAIPVPGRGRAEGDPPVNGTQWDIVQDYTISGSTIPFAGNITVFTGVSLIIKNLGRLAVPHNVNGHWVLFVKAGGNVEVMDGSELDVDHYIAESGTGLTVLNNSIVKANGVFNATSSVTFTDSSLTVTAPSGSDPSQPGESAKLHLDSGYGGNIQRSALLVTAGNGQKGFDGDGTEGGAGGAVSVIVTSRDFSDTTLTAMAGAGGKGGTPGRLTANAGKGGRGGNLDIKVVGNNFMHSTITAISGNGGDGLGGTIGTGIDGGNGGDGGEAGTVNLRWTGKAISVSQGSNINISSGHGGKGGGGGQAQSAGKSGGYGGRGGNGGIIAASITCEGSMSLTDSILSLNGGYGPTGGVFGRAMPGGKDGTAGDGGDGGSCAISLALNDTFTASNCTIAAESGDGGAGGMGSTGGKGGVGGSSLLNLSLETLLTENTISLKNSALISRGGAGGTGGKGLSVGNSQGQPGDGGKGGGSKLFLFADKSVEMTGSRLLCDEGLNGTADPPAKPGNPGVGELYIYTRTVTMRNSIYSQSMGWVDNNDLWTLYSTPIVRTNPPIKPPHFLPRVEAGIAEEYWILTVRVQDIYGNPVTDGTINVEITRGDTPVAAKKAEPSGVATFQLLGSRYTPNAADDVFGIVYTVRATDDSGLFAYPVSAQMVEDRTVTLTIINKAYPPICVITQPDAKLTPILDASQYLHSDGGTDMYIVEGNAQDHPLNAMPVISNIEIKISDDGTWMAANFEMASQGFYKWNLTWDIYNWSVAKLAQYPSGMIPCPIYARSYNDRFWSDDLAHGGIVAVANITVKLLKIPPAPPEVRITKPVISTSGNISFKELPYEKLIAFDGTVLNNTRTRVIKWEWCFDDTLGYKTDFSSPISPATNASYSREKGNLYVFVVLKVFDNESARRVELLRAGVSYDEFGYPFETTDGSTLVKLRVLVKPAPTPPTPTNIPWLYIGLGVIALVMMLGAVQTYRVRGRQLSERKAKEERETLRIDISEMTCARCNDPIADPSIGCLKCKAQDALGQTQQRLLDMKGSGVNVTEAESMLEIGVDAFDSKSYNEAYEKAQEAKVKAVELEAKYQKTAKVISGWETRIAAMKVDRPEADMSEAETKVYHSRLALGRGDHDEAVKNLDGLEGVLAKADKVGVRKGAQELLESTKRMLSNIQKRGVIADQKIGSAIAEAETALERGTYDLVSSRCKEAEVMVKETNKHFMRASEQLRQSESRVLNAKGMGQTAGQTEDWLAQAKTAMAGGNYTTVVELTGRVLGFFGVVVKPAGVEKRVDWKREAAVLEGRDGKPAPPRPVAPPPAVTTTTLEVEPSPELKEAAEKLIKEAHDAVARAREVAADVTDGEQLLEKAKDAYKVRRYDEASDLAKSAKYLLAELAQAAPKAKPGAALAPAPRPTVAPTVQARPAAISGAAAELKAQIAKADDLMVELAAAGGDISGPEDKLKRAKAARDGGSPAVAMQYSKESIEEIEGLIKEYLDAKNSMEAVQKDLASARSRGLDVSDAEFQLKQARAAMGGGAFVRAADTAKMIDQMLKEMEPAGAPSKAAAPIVEPAPKAPSVKCPGCGRDAKPHWKTCPFCGTAMPGEKPAAEAPRPAVAPAPAAPEAPKPPVIVPAPAPKPPIIPAAAPKPPAAPTDLLAKPATCTKCNAALKPHWKVCPACGADVLATPEAGPPAAPKTERCPACGSKIESSWTSCPICNTALVPAKGVKPETPKKVLKVAKKPVAPGEPKPEAPKDEAVRTPVIKVGKKL